jgi:hypothetical protein
MSAHEVRPLHDPAKREFEQEGRLRIRPRLGVRADEPSLLDARYGLGAACTAFDHSNALHPIVLVQNLPVFVDSQRVIAILNMYRNPVCRNRT